MCTLVANSVNLPSFENRKNTQLLTVAMELARMAKSRPRKNQSEHSGFFFFFIVIISNTTYKNIQYTTLLTLLARLTTQDYITFSFPFTHTEREKNEKKKNKKTKTKTKQKEGKDATYYICTLGTSR